ncbi:hypothetical protein [Nocardia sp. NPDC057227]|uniref:hypothetical protein n=1 Tax=Nocardia sp. NPDC057227 TaxID=3346056 RepID=UPI0036310867
MLGKQLAVLQQGPKVRVQVPLRDPRIGVPGDPLQPAQRHPGVGEQRLTRPQSIAKEISRWWGFAFTHSTCRRLK